eukprot:m.177259 g.177259  ORF g.177259 m.177259 type:complete len:134 (+) comp16570_c9_seq1:406-807(+)
MVHWCLGRPSPCPGCPLCVGLRLVRHFGIGRLYSRQADSLSSTAQLQEVPADCTSWAHNCTTPLVAAISLGMMMVMMIGGTTKTVFSLTGEHGLCTYLIISFLALFCSKRMGQDQNYKRVYDQTNEATKLEHT